MKQRIMNATPSGSASPGYKYLPMNVIFSLCALLYLNNPMATFAFLPRTLVSQHGSGVANQRTKASTQRTPQKTSHDTIFLEMVVSTKSSEIPTSEFSWDGPKYDLNLLIIDHYDSFTYNLYDYFAQRLIHPPTVVAKDAYPRWKNSTLSTNEWDGIILSPGPGTPQEQPLLSKEIVDENPNLPIFGVCLGHQLLSLQYGATVDTAPTPIHGQDHWITQEDGGDDDARDADSITAPDLFADLPKSFRVVRYHSLAATNLPDELRVTAKSKGDGVIQGIQHISNPHYGVQFHPESIGTQHGMALVDNFCKIATAYKDQRVGWKKSIKEDSISREQTVDERETNSPPQQSKIQQNPRFKVMVHGFESSVQPIKVFEELYANHHSHAVWLDSSSYPTRRGELDILAAPLRESDRLEYHHHHRDQSLPHGDILTQLEAELFGSAHQGQWIPSNQISFVEDCALPLGKGAETIFVDDLDVDRLPFHYRGGFLGYLGYEVRHDTERYLHAIESAPPRAPLVNDWVSAESKPPTAAFFLARQSMVFHHPTQTWYLIGLVEHEQDQTDILEWMEATKIKVQDLERVDQSEEQVGTRLPPLENRLSFVPSRPRDTYERNIGECHEFIRQGESYELCLTNQLEAKLCNTSNSRWDLYKILRQKNPAPYSGYFKWGNKSDPASIAICSSSPERFMSVQRQQPHPEVPLYFQAEAKPIKGTEARVIPKNGVRRSESEEREDERRARSLELSLKNRAENLMIVDLLRNDMSRVCEVGSVHVAKLMGIESFATVHQMVSTIRGTLRRDMTTIDLLRASFPGGSMTGAPKIRTMELLEELEEGQERGPYSGSLGYLSVNGCMDMNIIIRSAILTNDPDGGQLVRVGAGGAITALSEAEDEYNEMLLKSRAVVEAIQAWAGQEPANATEASGDVLDPSLSEQVKV